MPSVKQLCKSVLTTSVVDLHDTEARDNLANERTFLAWIRTAFATAALGILLARLQTSGNSGNNSLFTKILALAFIIIGLLCIIAGAFRYAHIQVYLEQKKYPTTGIIVTLVTFAAFGSFVATFILVLL